MELARKNPGITCTALPESVTDLCGTRQWIWEEFAPKGRFVMIDDDIREFQKRDDDGDYRRLERPDQIWEMWADLEQRLDDGAGVSAPRGRWSPPRKGPDLVSCGDVAGVAVIDGPRLYPLGLRWDRAPYIEDWDFYLQVLSHGIDTVYDQRYSFVTEMTGGAPGGQNEGLHWGDRLRLARRAKEHLATLWPDHMTRTARGWTIWRRKLLEESRRRLGMEEQRCECCGAQELLSADRSGGMTCTECQEMVAAVGGQSDRAAAVLRYLRAKERSPSTAPGKKRGRPPLGRSHPVVKKLEGKGPFRVEEVSEFFKNRGSASVALANMVTKGLLRRVTTGVYEVVPEPVVIVMDEKTIPDPALDPTLMSGGQ